MEKKCFYLDHEVVVNAYSMSEDGDRIVLIYDPSINSAIWVPAETLEIREVID